MFDFINPSHIRNLNTFPLPLTYSMTGESVLSVNFTRASTSTGTDATDTIRSYAANEPAWTYETGQKGLQFWRSGTNHFKWSEDLSHWTGNGGSSISLTSEIAPDGTTNSLYKWNRTTTGAAYQRLLGGAKASTAAEVVTCSGYVKKDDARYFAFCWENGGSYPNYDKASVIYDLETMAVYDTKVEGNITNLTAGIKQAVPFVNGFYRFWLTATSGGTYNTMYCDISFSESGVYHADTDTSDSVGGYVWGIQGEVSPWPTSYMKTGGSETTRSEDSLIIDGNDFTKIWNDEEGSFLIDWNATVDTYDANGNTLISISDGTLDNRIELFQNQSYRNYRVAKDGVGSVTGYPTSAEAGNHVDVITFSNDGFNGYIDGYTKFTDSTTVMPVSVDRMGIGTTTGNAKNLSGIMHRAIYYPRKLSDTEAVILSSKYVDVITEGDSYMAGAGGIGLNLSIIADGYKTVATAVGGSTLAQQLARVQANPLAGRKLMVFCDGSPNRTDGIYNATTRAEAMADYQAIYSACNGNIIFGSPMMFAGAYNTDLGQFALDLTIDLINTFGPDKVADITAIARNLSGATFTDPNDASDAGYADTNYDALFQADNVHMGQTLCDSVALSLIG